MALSNQGVFMKKFLFVLLVCVLLGGIVFAEETILHPTTIQSVQGIVTIYGTGNIQGLKQGEEATLQVLTFQESEIQEINQITEELYINGKTIFPEYTLDEFGNKYVLFKINENGDFNYEITVDIKTNAQVQNVGNYEIVSGDGQEKIYLEPSQKIESDSSEILTIVKNKFLDNDFFKTLDEVTNWVNSYVEYASGDDFPKYYQLQASALETLESKVGVCDEFANLSAAMLRAKGIPTRLAIGVVFDGKDWGNHAWLEVHHPQLGWVSTDPTFNESSFVDGTHIKMGSFNDVTMSLAKATYPSMSRISFNTQTLPSVEILEKNYFNVVSVGSNIGKIVAMQWNPINVVIKNTSGKKITVPVTMQKNFSEIIIKENKKTITLESGEQQNIIFEIYPNVELETNNTIALAKIKIITLAEPYEKDYNIVKAQIQETGDVRVKDITPIVDGNKLRIQISIENFSSKNEEATIELTGGAYNEIGTETISAFSISTFTKEINNFEEDLYKLKITVGGQVYSSEINPIKVIANQNQTDVNIQPDFNKNIPGGAQQDLLLTLAKNPITLLIIILLIIALASVIVFAIQKKRYF